MLRAPTSPRREFAVILALTALGAGLRLRGVWRLGLDHFDEGIYAAAGSWAFAPAGLVAIDLHVIAYAPPGMPILVGLAYLLLGPSDFSAIAVSLLAGIVTIPVVAWVGRRTFGPGAGAAAGALAALSGPHVAFSRMALTDVPFLLAWLACIGLGGRFLERPRFGRAVALGMVVGLAQNIKYNGWLAGVVVALAAVMGRVVHREGGRIDLVRTICLGMVAALVAALVYWPWFGFVEDQVGYRSLLAHHRSYLGGVASWWPHWRAQLAQSVTLSGGITWGMAAWIFAWIGAAITAGGLMPIARTDDCRWGRSGLGLLAGMIAVGTLPNLPWWAGLAASPWLVLQHRPAMRLLGGWWMILSTLTPCYHPYARLWLPLHSTGWLMLGGLIAEFVRRGGPAPYQDRIGTIAAKDPSSSRAIASRRAVIGVVMASALFDRWAPNPRARPHEGLLRPSDSIRRAVTGPDGVIEEGRRFDDAFGILLTLVRPSVEFYLGRSFAIRRQEGLDQLLRKGQSGEWALVDEVLLRQEGDVSRARDRLLSQWEPVKTWPVTLTLPTLLDVDPDASFEGSSAESPALLLLRRKSFGAGP